MKQPLVVHKKYVINTNTQREAFLKMLQGERRLWSVSTIDDGNEYFMVVRTYNRALPLKPQSGGTRLGP